MRINYRRTSYRRINIYNIYSSINNIYIHIHIHIHISNYTHTHVYTHTHIYTHIHIYTHTTRRSARGPCGRRAGERCASRRAARGGCGGERF